VALIYHTRTEHKIQKLNSGKKYGRLPLFELAVYANQTKLFGMNNNNDDNDYDNDNITIVLCWHRCTLRVRDHRVGLATSRADRGQE